MNEKRKSLKRIILVTIVLGAMVLGSFSVLASNAMAETPRAQSGNSTLIIAFQQDIPNLNYFDPNTNTVWKSDAIGWGWDSLMGYTPDLTPYKALAKDVKADSTGLNVTVTIRQGVTFQDGVKMTADDVVFSYEALAQNQQFKDSLSCLWWQQPKWNLWNNTGKTHVGVVKVNDYTVEFHLARPYPLFYFETLGLPILPSHIWQKHTKSAGIADSNDFILDYSYGKDSSQMDATIGTGPFKVVKWEPQNYIIIKRYDNYWGKNFKVLWQGREWSMFPANVTEIEFKIYNTLDTAVLALKKGEVHYIDWSIPPGYYNQLQTDPRIGSQVVDDQGFFYLAFNMRKAPENDLAFREAVAHAINKDYIVTTLMQGYGTKGTVPISITSGAYVNTSAIPPTYDLQAAKTVLSKAGYKDVDGDGWIDTPTGKPIHEVILTPPKDYDPIRAEAGIMIQNNLQKIHLNVMSNPTDFDTIVSKAFVQVSFDMYILGWAVGSFPETYLKDFFYSKDAAPVGYNTPGYSNPKVDKLLDDIETQMDTQKRIQEVKDVEGILVHDLPYDTLYYRKNIMAYRKDIWQGWVPAFGTIYNSFSLGQLHHPSGGSGGGSGGGQPSVVYGKYNGAALHMYIPDFAYAGKGINGIGYVTDFTGTPIKGVNVTVTASTGFVGNFTSGDSGAFKFHIPLAFIEYGGPVTVNYHMSAKIGDHLYSYNGSKKVTVYLPKNMVRLQFYSDKAVVQGGANATITAKVTDVLGYPVPGVPVKLLTEETAGNITPTTGITDKNGEVSFTYTAPTKLNQNIVDIIKGEIQVNNTILPNAQKATLYIGVENTGSTWTKVEILSVSSFGISAGNSSTVTVKVVDQDNKPVAKKEVHIEAMYSTATDPNWYGQKSVIDTTNVTFDKDVKTTDSNGVATFKFIAKNNVNRPYIVRAYVQSAISVSDAVEIYVGNVAPHLVYVENHTYTYNNKTGNVTWDNHTEDHSVVIGSDSLVGAWEIAYGMIMHVSAPVATVGQKVDVSMSVYYAMKVHKEVYSVVYNATSHTIVSKKLVFNGTIAHAGDPAKNVLAFMAVFGTDLGFGADWSNGAGTYVGWAGQSIIGSLTDENGTFAYSLDTMPLMSDEPIYISGWIDAYGYGTNAAYVGLGFEYPYLFGVKDGFALERAPLMSIKDVTFENDFLSDASNSTVAVLNIVDENNKPLPNVNVSIKIQAGSYKGEVSTTSDDNGNAKFNISVPDLGMDTLIHISVMLSSQNHAMTYNYEYVLPYLANISGMLNLATLYNVSISPDPIPNNGTATITLKYIGGFAGTPLKNVPVTLYAPVGTLDKVTNSTDPNGTVTFKLNAPDLLNPQYYTFAAEANGMWSYFGVDILGEYNSSNEARNTIIDLNNTIEQLKNKMKEMNNTINSLTHNATESANEVKDLKTQLQNAETMQYVYLGLFVVFLIIAPIMYILGKKSGAKAAPPAEEEPEEESEMEEEPEEELEMEEEPEEESNEDIE